VASTSKNEPRARNQVVTPRTSRRLDRARSHNRGPIDLRRIFRTGAAFARPAAALVAIVLLVLGYNALASSQLFLLHRVTVSDAEPALRADIEQIIRRTVGQTRLMDVDLSALRQKIEAMPRVRGASVARLLPDGVFVKVVERQPAVLVRRESEALVWLDEEAVEVGEFSDVKPKGKPGATAEIPPIAKGFAEGNRSQGAIAEDRERIAIYKQMEREFSEEPNPVWRLIDQIDLTFPKSVSLRLASPPVQIHIGSTDFRKRFEKALQVLLAVKRGDSELPSRYRVPDIDRLIKNADNISFISAASNERIVVNIASPGAQKTFRQEPKKKKD
jgi:POTRA domain, FtsQ-type